MSVQALYKVTKQLVELLEKSVPKQERDDHIVQIEKHLEARELIMEQLKPPYTDEEMRLGRAMIEAQKLINEKLKTMKSQIQLDINQLNKTKESNNKYTNPYQSVSNGDGMFFDRKK
ncbi:flagellar protein FliT [Bacillus sp. PS06]|uniref:flagellar protein FliT n=1 Tax=Bacillus sp. PS06 TaxID=2764176 RepID=UPI00177F2D64|nr:flagellar protein FliT [Bacillus sp. PS06]MBD8071406.1 flagellar protein FliT [Bacillus sp. PS06]